MAQAKSNEAEELRKKLRHQTAQLEVEKRKCKDLEEQLSIRDTKLENARLDDEGPKAEEKNSTESTDVGEEETRSVRTQLSKKDDEIRVLTEKLQHANAKLYETKNACTSLRQEVNKAQKVRTIGLLFPVTSG